MSIPDLTALRSLASKCDDGWYAAGNRMHDLLIERQLDKDFVEAASPEVVLALLDHIADLTKKVAQADAVVEAARAVNDDASDIDGIGYCISDVVNAKLHCAIDTFDAAQTSKETT